MTSIRTIKRRVRVKNGQCYNCGRKTNKKRCKKCNDYSNARSKRLYESGLCKDCGKQPRIGPRCRECMNKNNEKAAKRKAALEDKQ